MDGEASTELFLGGAFVFPETPGVTQMESLTPCSYVPRIKGTNDQAAGDLLHPTRLTLNLCALSIPVSACYGILVRAPGTSSTPRLLWVPALHVSRHSPYWNLLDSASACPISPKPGHNNILNTSKWSPAVWFCQLLKVNNLATDESKMIFTLPLPAMEHLLSYAAISQSPHAAGKTQRRKGSRELGRQDGWETQSDPRFPAPVTSAGHGNISTSIHRKNGKQKWAVPRSKPCVILTHLSISLTSTWGLDLFFQYLEHLQAICCISSRSGIPLHLTKNNIKWPFSSRFFPKKQLRSKSS